MCVEVFNDFPQILYYKKVLVTKRKFIKKNGEGKSRTSLSLFVSKKRNNHANLYDEDLNTLFIVNLRSIMINCIILNLRKLDGAIPNFILVACSFSENFNWICTDTRTHAQSQSIWLEEIYEKSLKRI